MALYEIVIGNNSDDRTYSKLVLSEEPLSENNINIKSISGIDEEWGEYILDVSIARIDINSWDEEEETKLMNIKNQLIK